MNIADAGSSSGSIAYQTLRWQGDASGQLVLIDQTLLPQQFREIVCDSVDIVWEAIRQLRVRGAPAIGVAAAYGVVLGTRPARQLSRSDFDQLLQQVTEHLAASRPTAVNLFWALNRMRQTAAGQPGESAERIHDALLREAMQIDREDRAMCDAIGQHGHNLFSSGVSVLTHCNAGALATSGSGTALSVIFAAAAAGKQIHVFADETRPLLQGARLTAWELQNRGIPVTVICDNMAAQVMKEGRVQAVITGADRIAANGDSANKIGTYGVAVLAKHHGIPFYIAAPSSTFDLSLPDGSQIPIEQRHPDEIAQGFGTRTVPAGVDIYNPAFDVTPAELIAAIVTERGVIHHPTSAAVEAHLQNGNEIRTAAP